MAALVAGLAFAVLPIHAEAVASVVGVAEGWALALQLGALALALRRDAWAWASLFPLALALLSKESSVVLGPLLLLLPWVGPRPEQAARPEGAAIGRGVAALLLVFGYLGLRVTVMGGLTGQYVTATVNPLVVEPWSARVPMALELLGRYLWLSVAGQPLSAKEIVQEEDGGGRRGRRRARRRIGLWLRLADRLPPARGTG